jgi:hypothetical protein
MVTSHSVLLIMKNISYEVVEKIKAHFMFNNSVPKIVPFKEVMWKNTARSKRAAEDNTQRRTRFACRILRVKIKTHNQNM